MAVFPDRIVFKNSTDDEATIISSIESGGTDAITPGEIVLGLGVGSASIYTLDSAGSVVNIFGNAIAGTTLDSLSDVNVPSPSDLDVLAWDAPNNEWISRPANPLNDISSNFLGDLGNVVITAVAIDQVIRWDGSNWVNHTLTLDYSSDVTLTAPASGEYLKYDGASWVNAQIDYSEIANNPTNLSDFSNDSGFLTGIQGQSIGDLSDVTITSAASGDTLVWSGTDWVNQAAPPADISSNSIGDLNDVLLGTPTSGEVLRYDGTNWVDTNLDYTDIQNRPTDVSDLNNDAGYILDINSESINDLSDVNTTGLSENDVLVWDGVSWVPQSAPPADISSNSIGDLDDVTIAGASISIDNIDYIEFNSPLIPASETWELGIAANGISMAAYRESDLSGSYALVGRTEGVVLTSTVQVTSLKGTGAAGTNTPELRWEDGNHFFSLKTPSSLSGDVTLSLPDSAGTAGYVLSTDGVNQLSWIPASGVNGLGDLVDVDLNTIPPAQNYALRYQDTTATWVSVPASTGVTLDSTTTQGATTDNNISTGYLLTVQGDNSSNDGRIKLNCSQNSHGVTIQSPPHADAASYSLILPSTAGTVGQVLTSQGGAQLTWEDVAAGGGGSGGSGAGIYLTETETSTGGEATFTGLGYSGILQKVTSTVDAWIVLYTSAAERTADASRAFEDDPSTSSGVLAEFYVAAGTTVLATPGTTYLNNDTTLTEAIYAAVRTQAGAAVVSDVTISAYGLAAITAVSGGTFGSGV